MIIGCDLHTRYQQIAMVDTDTGELVERRLEHESGEARAFYAGLKGAVRVGIEATGHTAVVRGHAGGVGPRTVDGRCGEDSRGGGAQAEDGRAGRGASVGLVVYESISDDLAAVARGAGSAATVVAPAEVGVDVGRGEEPDACAGHGRRRLSEEEVVHRERTHRTGRTEAGSVGELSAAGVTADVR